MLAIHVKGLERWGIRCTGIWPTPSPSVGLPNLGELDESKTGAGEGMGETAFKTLGSGP